jgi:heme/copper-type cytochrome/quinol oxidase subunit 4
MPSFLKKLLFIYPFIYPFIFSVQAQEFQVSLLTCDPGDELYSAFGHSAIRILDKESGRDAVYNYGTFDFNTPFFYVKFTQRTLDYMLSVTTYERFLYEYHYFQRGVREQVLDLNEEQTNELVKYLEINYLPDNRFYRYDFFYDNCATRIRDVFEQVLGRNLDWNEENGPEQKTFRQLIDEYVYPLPWADFGIDLALGSVIDVNASEREKQFLPDYMEAAFGRAKIVGDGPTRPLVKSEHVVLEFEERPFEMDLFNPYLIWWLLAIVVIAMTFWGYKKNRLLKGFDVAFFSILGLLGIVIILLWFFTFHSQTKYNWNILWAFPGHLAMALALIRNKPRTWLKKYFLFALIMANVALFFWILGVQSFHPSIIPLLLIVILRTNFLYYNWDKFLQAEGFKVRKGKTI